MLIHNMCYVHVAIIINRHIWFQMTLACSGTSRISAPWPKTEVRQKQWERWILATRPPGTVASDKALAHQLCRIKFLQRESRETSTVFIRRKKEYMWIHTHTHTHTHVGSENESHPHGSWNHFYGAYLPGFIWPIISLCLVLSLKLVYLRVLPCVHASLSQDGF